MSVNIQSMFVYFDFSCNLWRKNSNLLAFIEVKNEFLIFLFDIEWFLAEVM